MIVYESLLPLSLIRSYTKTDDDVYVTDQELSLLRAAAFEELAKYNKKFNFSGRKDVEQQVILKMSNAGFIYDQKIDLDYPATSSFVTVSFEKVPNIQIKCAYKAKFIYLTIGGQEVCYNSCRSTSPVAILYYQTGEKCPEILDQSIILGCLNFIRYILYNKEESKKMQSIVVQSGAYDLWK